LAVVADAGPREQPVCNGTVLPLFRLRYTGSAATWGAASPVGGLPVAHGKIS